jgi:aspartate aminotransferase
MKIQLSEKVGRIKPSPTLAVAARALELKKQGLDIIDLSVGEPDFDTPQHIKDAATKALEAGYTKYTPVDGIAAVKQAIANKLKRENQLNYELGQIMVSTGAKQCLFNLCASVLNPNDEAIIPAPFWVSYPDIVLLTDGTPVTLPSSHEQHFKISAQQLEKAITPKSKLFFINSPSNPSGMMYSLEELKNLGEVLKKHPQVIIVTDDIYEHVCWKGNFVNILNACPELYDRTIVVNGVSKSYAMTGWRIGYAAGPLEVINAMKKVQSQSTSNPNSIAQHATVAALNEDQSFIQEMTKAFKERHDYFIAALNSIPGFDCLANDGTFYAFAHIEKAMKSAGLKNDIEFAEFLLDKAQIAAVPGSAFGTPGYIRFSYATKLELLKKAIERIKQICA